MLPPRRHGGPVHNALKLLTDRSRRRSNNDNVEGGEGARGAWLKPRRESARLLVTATMQSARTMTGVTRARAEGGGISLSNI